jgi:hypothetical protein
MIAPFECVCPCDATDSEIGIVKSVIQKLSLVMQKWHPEQIPDDFPRSTLSR